MIRRLTVATALALTILACAGPQLSGFTGKPVRISGLVIRNETGSLVTDVILEVENAKEIVSVSPILAGSYFSTSFPLRTYQGNRISVTWNQGAQTVSSGKFRVAIPEGTDREKPVVAEILIFPGGGISAQTVPEPP